MSTEADKSKGDTGATDRERVWEEFAQDLHKLAEEGKETDEAIPDDRNDDEIVLGSLVVPEDEEGIEEGNEVASAARVQAKRALDKLKLNR